jgi:hypothetical protein
MRKVFYSFFVPYCKEQNDLKLRELRSAKAAKSLYKAFYFMFATAWGYYVLKDEYYLPPSLGGRGLMVRSFEEHPFAKHAEGLKTYILVTMGYHVGSLITHFIGTRKNDFVEMALHHIVCIYLFAGMYLYNIWEVGSAVAFLHDIADITTNWVKMLAETKDKKVVPVLFVFHMGIWFWTRLFILPQYIWFMI